MNAYGAKNSVERLEGTDIVPENVCNCYDFDALKENFPKSLAKNIRVLKKIEIQQGGNLARRGN